MEMYRERQQRLTLNGLNPPVCSCNHQPVAAVAGRSAGDNINTNNGLKVQWDESQQPPNAGGRLHQRPDTLCTPWLPLPKHISCYNEPTATISETRVAYAKFS
jgi:hypothetical protein